MATSPRTDRPRAEVDLVGTEVHRRARRHHTATQHEDHRRDEKPTATERKTTMSTATTQRDNPTPKIFRITLEVSNLDEAAAFYARLLDNPGKRHPGARHYFDCGGVILAVLDPTQGGVKPTPGPKSLYFAVHDIEA